MDVKQFNGAYAGFLPKPAIEIIITIMKPLPEKTYLDQALANGNGVSWLGDCRIPYVNYTDIENPHRFNTAFSSEGSNEGDVDLEVKEGKIRDNKELLEGFNEIVKEHFTERGMCSERQLNYMSVEDLFGPFTI